MINSWFLNNNCYEKDKLIQYMWISHSLHFCRILKTIYVKSWAGFEWKFCRVIVNFRLGFSHNMNLNIVVKILWESCPKLCENVGQDSHRIFTRIFHRILDKITIGAWIPQGRVSFRRNFEQDFSKFCTVFSQIPENASKLFYVGINIA